MPELGLRLANVRCRICLVRTRLCAEIAELELPLCNTRRFPGLVEPVAQRCPAEGQAVIVHTGELAFASWAKPLRIVGVTTAPFGAAEGAYMQVPAGRRYAVISSRSCQRIERGVGFRLTGPQGDATGGGSSGRFYYAGAAALIPQSDNATQFSASGHFVLIDVTGH
ncbi:hypothetical protein QAD16_05920 [Stenotrophomonas geniculata]|jgi:hypothetical protein|nr:hypothetical protein [Stenotrophomonas geniculata]MDH7548869.1 hypothetical protein [Stenotrophomonas geniculata]